MKREITRTTQCFIYGAFLEWNNPYTCSFNRWIHNTVPRQVLPSIKMSETGELTTLLSLVSPIKTFGSHAAEALDDF